MVWLDDIFQDPQRLIQPLQLHQMDKWLLLSEEPITAYTSHMNN